jgi:hypothetical protein
MYLNVILNFFYLYLSLIFIIFSITNLERLIKINMNIKGEILQLLPLQTGEGKNGQWKRQQIIVETDGSYPKKICISVWGNLINEGLLKLGNTLVFFVELESKEFNSKWYTDIKAWKMELVDVGQTLPDLSISVPEKTNLTDVEHIFKNRNDESDGFPF